MTTGHKPPDRYPIPAAAPENPHSSQQIVRKSRFLASACHCATSACAREFVGLARSRNPGATHYCWAFVAGPPGDTAAIGASDDGEPKGTAGRPMLDVLLGQGPGEICVVVARWFGGIKLGTGGLVRAYQDAVAQNLASLPLASKTRRGSWQIVLDYAFLDACRRLLPQLEASIETETFTDKATLLLTVPEDRVEAMRTGVANLTRGLARLSRLAPCR